MAKNKLSDLVDHLFCQMERLNPTGEGEPDPEAVRLEISRAGAMTGVAREIIAAGRLALEAAQTRHELGGDVSSGNLLGFDRENGR